MSDEHIDTLREMRLFARLHEEAALDAAIAALGAVEPVAEVRTVVIPEDWGRHPRSEYQDVSWLSAPPASGTKLYALPAPPSKEG